MALCNEGINHSYIVSENLLLKLVLRNFPSFLIFFCKPLGIGQSLTVRVSLTVGNWVGMSQSPTVCITLSVRDWFSIVQSLTVSKISLKWLVFIQILKTINFKDYWSFWKIIVWSFHYQYRNVNPFSELYSVPLGHLRWGGSLCPFLHSD